MTPVDLPPRVLAVLEAMTRPDPLPPARFDGPAAAVYRRLPALTGIEAAEIFCALNALGLTTVPDVVGMVSPAVTADLTKWITEGGWAAMGVGLASTTNRQGSDIGGLHLLREETPVSAHRPMSEREKQLFQAFKIAIEREREAQVEYGKMAALAEDPHVRGIFEGLQREEGKHEQQLVRLYAGYKAHFIPE